VDKKDLTDQVCRDRHIKSGRIIVHYAEEDKARTSPGQRQRENLGYSNGLGISPPMLHGQLAKGLLRNAAG
jgi:hypothetical protein